MARRAVIEMDDDQDGGPADETLEITFDGFRYTTDLNSANAATLRAQLKPWLDAAWQKRKVSHKPKKAKAVAKKAATGYSRGEAKHAAIGDKELRQKVRNWAREHGHQIGEKGIISQSIQDAYRAAHHGQLA